MNVKICKNCKTQLPEDAAFCNVCGAGSDMFAYATETSMTPDKKSGKGKKAGAVVSFLIVIIASLVGKFAGGYITENLMEGNMERKIDKYIEQMADYKPGVASDESYISEFLGLKFETGEEWVMYTAEELEPFSANMRESAIGSAVNSLKKDELSQEIIDKWTSAVYAKSEAGAYYVADDMVAGEMTFGFFGAYGADEVTEEEFAQEMADGLKSSGESVIGEETVAGYTYKSVETKLSADGMNMTNKMLIRISDGMVCMINCKWIDGYEVVYDSFMKHISEY